MPTPEQRVVMEQNNDHGGQTEQNENPTENINSKYEQGNSKYPTRVCDMSKHLDELSDPGLYRAIVGSLIYVMTCARQDSCYIVTKLSQNMAKPTKADLNQAKCTLRYFKGTQEQCLKFKKSESPLRSMRFCDSDWGAPVKDLV